MKRSSFLKRLAGLIVAPSVVQDLEIPDPLLEEFEKAGIEEERVRRENEHWVDRMAREAWEEGRKPSYLLVSPEARMGILKDFPPSIGPRGIMGSVEVYDTPYASLRMIAARELPWVELNEHGACLLDEYPATYREGTIAFSGGPLNGQTRRKPGIHVARTDVPVWNGHRFTRFAYRHDRRGKYPSPLRGLAAILDIYVPLEEA